MSLELRGLNYLLRKINRSKRYELFYNEQMNNLVIFDPHDKDTDTDSICNYIREKPYRYLIEKLNKERGIVVYWSQVSGATSDYVILYGMDVEELRTSTYGGIIEKVTRACKRAGRGYRNKYSAVIDGKVIEVAK